MRSEGYSSLFVFHCVWYNTPGLSSGQNAKVSTSTKYKRYSRVFWLVDFANNAYFKRYCKICKLRSLRTS